MTKTFMKYRSRVTVVSSFVIITWVVLSMRLFQIMIVDGDGYREKGMAQAKKTEPIPFVRGNIYDRKNRSLTKNIIQYSFAYVPNSKVNPEEIATALSGIGNRSDDYYKNKILHASKFTYLERNVKRQDCISILQNPPEGLITLRNPRRYYPHLNIASQILGLTNVDDIGIAGIEMQFESYLTGENGWIVKQKTNGGALNPKNGFPSKQPVDGKNIQLTIDLDYQAILQAELLSQMNRAKAVGATGIILNPQTGSILAMASLPDFDPNRPGLAPIENQKNRSITDQFEPGSTFKIVPASAALDRNAVSLLEEFNCENGSFLYAGQTIKDWEDFGLLTFSQVMEQSSNVGVIKVADRLGPNTLHRYARDFGFGMSTSISLPGEVPGILKAPKDWSGITLAELSLGHEVGVTALQLALAYASVANGGFLIKPRIVNQIMQTNTNGKQTVVYAERPEIIRKVMPESVSKTMRDILVKAVDRGTGMNAAIPGWSVAGKTGTAQKFIDGKYSDKKFISNFVGFFPAENPQLLAVVILDEPAHGFHWGGQGAAPVFRKVMQRIINMDDSFKRVPQKYNREPEPILAEDPSMLKKSSKPVSPIVLATQNFENVQSGSGRSFVPNVRGMSLKKAKRILKKRGLKVMAEGSGQVIWQYPEPGTILSEGAICKIGLK